MKDQRLCRLCGGEDLAVLVSLKGLPVSHGLRRGSGDPDPRFDVELSTCRACGLTQIVDPIAPEILYVGTDTYTTGFHRPRHIDDLITSAVAHADPGSVVDIGCNDGALMDALKRHGHTTVVGIEPNTVAARAALAAGHTVHCGFLGVDLADKLAAAHGAFDAAYLRHVAEHVTDLAEFFAAIRTLLRPDGLLVMELPQVEPGFVRGNPAVLWEEHVNYFTEPLAEYLLARHGFAILERRRYAFGGGSIAFVARKVAPAGAPLAPPNPARSLRLARKFKSEFAKYRRALREAANRARQSGRLVAMYGAAPRSCMVAATCGISGFIDVVIDDRKDIHGRLMPGTARPIEPLEAAAAAITRPVLCLLGVGAENEFKVKAKMAASLREPPLCISLFPPRDTLASIASALPALTTR